MPVKDPGKGWQTGYRTAMDIALPGLMKLRGQCNAYINTVGIVVQVAAIDIGTPANDTQYDITVDGVAVSYTSDADATFAEIRDGLVAALEASATISANWFATTAGSDPGILLTARNATASAVTVTVGGGGTGYQVNSGASVTPSLPTAIPFGRMVTQRTAYESNQGHLPNSAGELQLGISVRSHDVQPLYETQADDLTSAYQPRDPMNVLSRGVIWVECEAAIALGDGVWYRHTANGALDQNGIFAPATGTGLEQLVAARWEGPSVTVQNFSGGASVLIAPLWINLP